ncbi:ABC transporter permease [Microbacterium halophytorum]|uniref:ABC transporter permease n=1 Tax=Microbacterium halophytorum TaxID=2067568 RepID=UPI000CFAF57E|nr:ABC transporter permease [Microbacterium halophytorum]
MNGATSTTLTASVAVQRGRADKGARLRSQLVFLAPIVALLVLIVFFAIATPTFLTAANFQNLVRQMAVLLVVALGATYVVLIGSIDLSIGSIVTLTGVSAAMLTTALGPWGAALGFVVGLLCGLINGIVHVYVKVPSFIVTLGTMFVFAGIALIVTGGRPQALRSPELSALFGGTLFGVVPTIALWALLALVVAVVIERLLVFGYRARAVGDNETVAKLSGIDVRRVKLTAFVLSGVFASFAGLLLMVRTNSASGSMGDPFLMEALAAILLGGTSLMGGVGGPSRTVLGVLVISVLSNGMNLASVDPFQQQTIKGVVLIAAVAVTLNRRELSSVK